MQLALEAAGRAAYKEACHAPKINSHGDDDYDDDYDDDDDDNDDDDDVDNGSKWKCQAITQKDQKQPQQATGQSILYPRPSFSTQCFSK
ncbi:hypothetical protein ACLKA6_000067 [Drosophila palustris]